MEPDIALWGWADVYMGKMPLKGVTLQVNVESQSLPKTKFNRL
ncbi:hypothetical protein [Bacillus sp. V3B]|nr:hypothetical protein [Bacillus sp. V3B]